MEWRGVLVVRIFVSGNMIVNGTAGWGLSGKGGGIGIVRHPPPPTQQATELGLDVACSRQKIGMKTWGTPA